MTPIHRLLLMTVLATCCASVYAANQSAEVHEHKHLDIDNDVMSWNSDGRLLRLHASTSGLAVDEANTLGLQRGDTITALGNQSIRTPQALLDNLRNLRGHSAALQVRGADGNTRTVRLSAVQYADLIPPPPPAPPLPPPPPPKPKG